MFATLWQSEQGLAAQKTAFERKWKEKADQFNLEWAGTGAGRKAERDAAFQLIQQARDDEQMAMGATEHSGFSLDTSVDYVRLTADLERSRTDILKMLAVLQYPLDVADLDKVIASLRKRKDGEFFSLLRAMRQTQTPGSLLLLKGFEQLRTGAQFQKARYDGQLAGTEVGMNLFYTDLLAKLAVFFFSYSQSTVQIFLPVRTEPHRCRAQSACRQCAARTRQYQNEIFREQGVADRP